MNRLIFKLLINFNDHDNPYNGVLLLFLQMLLGFTLAQSVPSMLKNVESHKYEKKSRYKIILL